jgi:xanthine dehydrogenase accessory factor
MGLIAIIRGGGDLASGVAVRLRRSGIQVVITELSQPLAVRRWVSFAQAVYDREITIEGIQAVLTDNLETVRNLIQNNRIPVLIDPNAGLRAQLQAQVLVDGRMTKLPPDLGMEAAPLVVGLGPGFTAGENCHAVIETKRGPFLGRVYWQGSAEPDSGLPDMVANHQFDRVLRAPMTGVIQAHARIGDHLEKGMIIAEVGSKPVFAPFSGMLRGLLKDGLLISEGVKIGDLDPRDDQRLCELVSDKALSVGGGVLEAILSRPEFRTLLGD